MPSLKYQTCRANIPQTIPRIMVNNRNRYHFSCWDTRNTAPPPLTARRPI